MGHRSTTPTPEESQPLGTVAWINPLGRRYWVSIPEARRQWARWVDALHQNEHVRDEDRDEWYRNAHDPNWMPREAGPSISLIEAWLERLPSHTVTQTESLFTTVCVLPCGHRFRYHCIGNLFNEMPRSQCPECRRDYTQVSSSSCLILDHN